MTEIRPQKEFPLLEKYKKVFKIDRNTIFAYDKIIYTNGILPDHLIIHEETHLNQQKELGLDKWVDLYLRNKNFRLNQEIEAYKNQINSINDRNGRIKVRTKCAKDLSSELYGNIISYEEAYRLIK